MQRQQEALKRDCEADAECLCLPVLWLLALQAITANALSN